MLTSTFKKGLAIAGLIAITAMTSALIVKATPGGMNAGWYHKSYPTFAPRIFTKATGAVNANTAIYMPGVKQTDHIWMLIEHDSVGNAGNDFTDLTDSCYIRDDDTILIGTAITAGSDLILGVHRQDP